jgi:Uma2 family endonuclease
MAVQAHRMTIEEFKQFAASPENADRLFEYIGGEIVEVVCNSYSSLVAANILFLIKLYLRDNGAWAYVTGEAAGYMVAGESYIPDVGVLSKARQTEPPHETWIPIPPDLAVEVLSPTDKPKEISVKVVNYLAVGTTVWIVDPESEVIKICVPGQKVKTVTADGTLEGGDVLPGFAVAVKDIFDV